MSLLRYVAAGALVTYRSVSDHCTTSLIKADFFLELGGDGADGRNRTADLLITNQLLYRLSYIGRKRAIIDVHLLSGLAHISRLRGMGFRSGVITAFHPDPASADHAICVDSRTDYTRKCRRGECGPSLFRRLGPGWNRKSRWSIGALPRGRRGRVKGLAGVPGRCLPGAVMTRAPIPPHCGNVLH